VARAGGIAGPEDVASAVVRWLDLRPQERARLERMAGALALAPAQAPRASGNAGPPPASDLALATLVVRALSELVGAGRGAG